jgi:hypothetical protein
MQLLLLRRAGRLTSKRIEYADPDLHQDDYQKGTADPDLHQDDYQMRRRILKQSRNEFGTG